MKSQSRRGGSALILPVIVMLLLACGNTAFASDDEIALLRQQIEELKAQNQQLTERVTSLERAVAATAESSDASTAESSIAPAAESPPAAGPDTAVASSVPEELVRTKVQQAVRREMRAQQEEEGKSQKINDYVTLFGLIEAEAVFGEDYGGESFSEYAIATAELGFDAQVGEWTLGHILLTYEDDDLFVDEVSIWLGNYQRFPVLMNAGLFYMPFGNFETNMIQDPLTLEIGEINAPGIAVGFEKAGLSGALYSYKGLNETEASDSIRGFGARLGFAYEDEPLSVDLGGGLVSNIGDADGITDVLEEDGIDSLESLVPGLEMHLLAAAGPFSFIGEYVQALEPFSADELAFRERGAEPRAWNLELAYYFELLDRTTVVSLGYQATREAVDLGLPYSRYIGSASMVLLEGTTLTLEFYHDDDYDLTDGGTGEDARVFTGQLAYDF